MMLMSKYKTNKKAVVCVITVTYDDGRKVIDSIFPTAKSGARYARAVFGRDESIVQIVAEMVETSEVLGMQWIATVYTETREKEG